MLGNMKCRICNSQIENAYFKTKILKKYEVSYYLCPKCRALQSEEPFWLDEAYSNNQAITDADTGIMLRNQSLLAHIWYFYHNEIKRGKVLDYGGGYGVLTRLLRDIGIDCKWYDKYTTNLFARGFEWKGEKVELLLLTEVFEHFVNPIDELKNALRYSDTIMLSTLLYSNNDQALPPNKEEWWYYSFEQGQHILFGNKQTMKIIAKLLKVNYYNINGLHVFTKKEISRIRIKLLYNNGVASALKYVMLVFKIIKEKDSAMKDHILILNR